MGRFFLFKPLFSLLIILSLAPAAHAYLEGGGSATPEDPGAWVYVEPSCATRLQGSLAQRAWIAVQDAVRLLRRKPTVASLQVLVEQGRRAELINAAEVKYRLIDYDFAFDQSPKNIRELEKRPSARLDYLNAALMFAKQEERVLSPMLAQFYGALLATQAELKIAELAPSMVPSARVATLRQELIKWERLNAGIHSVRLKRLKESIAQMESEKTQIEKRLQAQAARLERPAAPPAAK